MSPSQSGTFPAWKYWPRLKGHEGLVLRQRWWKETNYGKKEPSAALQAAIVRYATGTECEKSTTEGHGDAEEDSGTTGTKEA